MPQDPAPASNLVLISDLRSIEPNTKVRLQGCVTHKPRAGRVALASRWPNHDPTCTCTVDVSVIIATLPQAVLDVGTWVNVVGYARLPDDERVAVVQATALWDVGPIGVDGPVRDVHKVIEGRRKMMEAMKRVREQYADADS